MPAQVSVLLTPVGGTVPTRATAVVVDVLRATSVLTQARLHGARAVVAAGTPEAALALRARHPGALLCGERDGRRITGFDLGNSPFEYGFENVGGRTLIFASTNGSRALLAAGRARRRILGAFVNASAVLEAVAADELVTVVCSGKLGDSALEDTALAGWLVERLAARGVRVAGAAAAFARRIAPRSEADVRTVVQGASHGRYLRSLGPGFARDVEFCAGLDTISQAFEV